MNKFKNLIVWQKSITLAGKVYNITDKLPSKERFGLTSQINSAVVSIASNIAEGCGRNSKKELNHFLGIANGSSYELETQLIICIELKYLEETEIANTLQIIEEIQKMLYRFQNKLTKPNPSKD